jgi:hypothetical protein
VASSSSSSSSSKHWTGVCVGSCRSSRRRQGSSRVAGCRGYASKFTLASSCSAPGGAAARDVRADSHRVHGFRPEASVRRSACDTWLFGRGTCRAAGQRWRGAFLFNDVDTDKLVDSADNNSRRRRGRRRGSGTGARRAVGPRRRGQMGTDVQSVHTTFSGSAASSSERSRYVVTKADFLATIHIDHHHPSTHYNLRKPQHTSASDL